MTETAISQILEHAQVMNLAPGDVIILRSEGRLTMEQAEALRQRVEGMFPGHQVIVLGGGLELAVGHIVTEAE